MNSAAYKVLLVEDDKNDQMAFERMVSSKNLQYDYVIASSVSEATSILNTDKFDIIIADHRFGDGTAFDVLELPTEVPTIFTTGVGNEELAIKAMKAGACDYLIKDNHHNYLKILPEVIKNTVRFKETDRQLKHHHDALEVLVKERTEQLNAEKERLAVTLSSITEGVIAVDEQKRITLFNKGAERLTGWGFEDAKNKSIDQVLRVVDERTKQEVEDAVDKVLGSRKTECGTDSDALIARDGSERAVFITAAPIHKDHDTIVGVVMVLRDVAKMREIDRMKADLISSVSHELRTPLTSIKAYTSTILSDHNMTEEIKRKYLNIVNEESDRLANLIENLLKVSRLESDTVKIDQQGVDIISVIEHVITALKPLADKKNIQLKMNIKEKQVELRVDEDKIRSVITNLVNNAIKFTPEGGQVFISVQHQDEELRIRISDTGMGVPKEALLKIFDRFYRVYRPGKQIQGTGLGLAIAKKIVMMHGGRIDVESQVNRGTTFTVYLPLYSKPAQKAVTAS